jgi:CBS domain-containing protein
MPIRDIVRTDIVTASTDQSAGNLATLMKEENVGSVVIEEEDRPVGIVTDRDLTLEVLESRADPREVTAGDVMTPDPATAGVDDGVFELIREMAAASARRMPVVADDGTIAGIVTLDDLVVLLADELESLAAVVEAESPPY